MILLRPMVGEALGRTTEREREDNIMTQLGQGRSTTLWSGAAHKYRI